MKESSIDPVDKHVGSRLRLARTIKGFSQSELGASEKITFQQVQKYETGANRISASRLFRFAVACGVSVSWFYEGMNSENSPDHQNNDVFQQSEIQDLVRAYYAVENEKQRKSVFAVLKSLGEAKI